MRAQFKFPAAVRCALALTGISALTLLCGCSQGAKEKTSDDQAMPSGPSFSKDVQPIFDTNCVTCHQTAGPSGGLNLESGLAYKAIVSVKSGESALPYITPGKPAESYLLRKLEGTHIEAGGSGERMPLTGPLEQQSIATVRDWVKAGAMDD